MTPVFFYVFCVNITAVKKCPQYECRLNMRVNHKCAQRFTFSVKLLNNNYKCALMLKWIFLILVKLLHNVILAYLLKAVVFELLVCTVHLATFWEHIDV